MKRLQTCGEPPDGRTMAGFIALTAMVVSGRREC